MVTSVIKERVILCCFEVVLVTKLTVTLFIPVKCSPQTTSGTLYRCHNKTQACMIALKITPDV